MSARLEKSRRPTFIIRGATLFGLSITILALTPSYLAYAIWIPICGFLALTTLIIANTLMQINSDPLLRGRIMGIYLLVFLGGAPLGSPLIGFMAEQIGIRTTMAGCGMITSIAASLAWLRYRNKISVPDDFSIDVVLPPIYDNKS
jgi:MFS family permease